MLTYLIINTFFTMTAVLISWRERKAFLQKPFLLALGFLLILTLVFDNLIISAGIVAYDNTKLSGLMLGLAPIEDFAYPLVGLILLPYVWKKLHRS